jgi:hypothetical protein
MAGLALGLPLVTNTGKFTEPVWTEEQLVAWMDPAHAHGAADALASWSTPSDERTALMERAAKGYRKLFGWDHVVERLRQ